MKQSVNIALNETKSLYQECNVELRRRVERMERYSRDYNIRVVGVAAELCVTFLFRVAVVWTLPGPG